MKEIVVRIYPREIYIGVAFARTDNVLHVAGFFSNGDQSNRDFGWTALLYNDNGFILDLRDCEHLSDPEIF